MSKKVVISIIAVVLIVGGILLYPKISLYLSSRKKTVNTEQADFYVKHHMDAKELAKELKSQGIIKNENALIRVAEYKGLNKENIAIGKYSIAPGTEYRTILNGFRLNAAGNGNAEVEVDVTFNNCRDIYQLAGKLEEKLLIDSTEFVSILDDEETLDKLGFTKEELPAMFLPNTYKMYFDTDEQQFIDRMAKEFKAFWTEERMSKLSSIGLDTPSEAVTLASIVYSEQSRNKSEWPIIAGLYLNRIDQGIKLQSDPTFKFCWGDKLEGVQRMLNVHRDIVCDYNTYQITGLPPGPICIPPTETVDAVLNRDNNKYIFMMAKPDYTGLHDFATDYDTHLKYAKVYQTWLANELKNQ